VRRCIVSVCVSPWWHLCTVGALIFHRELAEYTQPTTGIYMPPTQHPAAAPKAVPHPTPTPPLAQGGAAVARSLADAAAAAPCSSNYWGNLTAGVGMGAVTLFVCCHNIVATEWRQVSAHDDGGPSGEEELAGERASVSLEDTHTPCTAVV
jgi:hypothetical protein